MCLMRLNYNFCASVWLCFSPYGTNHFEGSMMTTERGFPDDGNRVVPKHDGDLLTSDEYILLM
jgi:hypothetical protein